MSQPTSGRTTAEDRPTEAARDEATEVGHTAADAGRKVAETGADQAKRVRDEATAQARDLVGEARTQLRDQARGGQQKAAEKLRSLADELQQMADGAERPGPASDMVREACARARQAADWIGQREPGDLLEEFRNLARRHPGAFLFGAAAAGMLAGRLTRGAADASSGGHKPGAESAPVHAPSPGYPATAPPAPPPYGGPAYAGPPAGLPDASSAPGPYPPAGPPGPYPPAGAPPTSGPVPAPRPGATTSAEYTEDVERGRTEPNQAREQRPQHGGPR